MDLGDELIPPTEVVGQTRVHRVEFTDERHEREATAYQSPEDERAGPTSARAPVEPSGEAQLDEQLEDLVGDHPSIPDEAEQDTIVHDAAMHGDPIALAIERAARDSKST